MNHAYRSAAVFTLLLTACGSAAEGEPPRPNVVLILSDDMGFTDLGCYGGEIDTPNLDRLAAGGLRFTQFYNTGRCCPTRASLMTGLYPHAAGVGHMTVDRDLPGYTGDLNDRCRTIPEVLGPAGYRNYMVGKWHVTKHTSPDGPKENWPTSRGFDRFYGIITGAGSFYDPPSLVRDGTMMTRFTDPEYQPSEYYWTDAITDHAVRHLREHERDRDDEPFFLYVAHTAAHWPMHALPEDIAKYQGRFDGGYEPARKARFAKAKELGIIAADAELSPRFGEWEDVKHKEWEARCMEVYAAMVDRMDRNIGRLVEELERTGELENTLILFLQDNGGCQEGVGRKPRKDYPTRPLVPPFEPTPLDHVHTDSRIQRTRDGWPVLSGPGAMPGPRDTYIAYGEAWANVSNTPFRLYKHHVHEGGIATPLIAHWPAGITRRGESEPQPGHLVDVAATVYDLAGAEYPGGEGEKIRPLAGVSLEPAFGGESLDRDTIYWEHEGNRAIREGDMKLVAPENKPWELYDLSTDRSELHDLSGKKPKVVERLEAKWMRWAEANDVLPLSGWRGVKHRK